MVLILDTFIDNHLHISKVKDNKRLKYRVKDLHELCNMSTALFKNEPTLVRMNPPCIAVGDIHGQYYGLLRMFSMYTVEGQTSGALNKKFVFMGDYVDRGRNSLECICLILALKNRFPTKYLVLRGNHEFKSICSSYGFQGELTERFGENKGTEVFDHFIEVFTWMPLAGLIGKKILCMHGGISPELRSFEDIEKIERPIMELSADNPLALDLVWADPQEKLQGFCFNSLRGISVFFGENEVHRVCRELNIYLIVRGHQVMPPGYGSFANRRLMTIFTAPRYQKEEPNAGATLEITERGHIGVHILDPYGDFETQPEQSKDDTGPDFLKPLKKKSEVEKSIEAKKSSETKTSEGERTSKTSSKTSTTSTDSKDAKKFKEGKKGSKVASKGSKVASKGKRPLK